VYIDILLHL